jgi:hypothetical protein
MTFNKDKVFNSNIESEVIKENIRSMLLKQLAELLKEIELPSEDKPPKSVNKGKG